MGTAYYKTLLSKQEQTLYDGIIRQLRQFKSSIALPAASIDEITRSFHAVRRDNPSLFFISNEYSVQASCMDSVLDVKLLYGFKEASDLLSKMNRIANAVAAHVRGMPDYQAATFIHDFLVQRLTYSEDVNARLEAHSIVGALIHHSCVCEGYAKAYKFLCDKAGIPCILVTGSATNPGGVPESHAWNIVKIGHDCCHVDVTFDKYIDNAYCSRAYLFLSSAEILTDHTLDTDYPVPTCPKSRLPLARVKDLSSFIDAAGQDRRKKLHHSEYALTAPVNPRSFIDALSKKIPAVDLMLNNSIKNFFFPEKKKVYVIGIRWR